MAETLVGRGRGAAACAQCFVLVSLMIVGFSLVDFVYARAFLAQSAAFARAQGGNALAQKWFALFGAYWQNAIALGVLCAIFGLKRKSDSLLIFHAYCVGQTLSSASRYVYQDLRPCHIDAVIGARSCICSFGKISHTACIITAMSLIGAVLLSENMRPTAKAAVRLAAVLFAANVGLARVFEGFHAWNQVVLGWLWGLWVAAGFALLRATHSETINGFLLREEGFDGARRALNGALFAFFLALNLLSLLLWARGERPSDEFVLSACFTRCVAREGMLDREIRAMGAHNWGIGFSLLWAVTAPPKTLSNAFFYVQSAKSPRLGATRALVFALSVLPLVATLALGNRTRGLTGYLACTAFGLLFPLGFFFATPRLLEWLDADLSGDFFTGGQPLREFDAGEKRERPNSALIA